MLTLEKVALVAGGPRSDTGFGGNGADRSGSGVGGSMAYESLVADAVCHLLTAFFTIEKLQRDHRSANTLEWASDKISVVLQSLDECSNAFWISEQSRNRTRCRIPLGIVFGGRRRQRSGQRARVIDASSRIRSWRTIFLNPVVMARTVKINPLLVFGPVLVGADVGNWVGGLFGGFVAVLVAVPIAASLQVVIVEIWRATASTPALGPGNIAAESSSGTGSP